ncbi:MAG TPA: class I SAM-dependent methyltransferase [Anaerolineales bacterium]|nr:class I SAM-dependent methyltransferase [Anaerolineales bacterium]
MSDRPVCDYEGSTYQNTFWEKGGRAYEDAVERIALRKLLPLKGTRLLEIGAGAGRLTNELLGYQQVVLTDYSSTQLEQARQRLGNSPQFKYVAANVYALPFAPALFDAASMVRVIHHLVDVPAALVQVREVLTPGATYLLEFANKQNLKAIARWLSGQQKWNPFSRGAVEFVALNFDFHPQDIQNWLEKADFRVGHRRTVSHYRMNLLKLAIPTDFLVWLDSWAQPTGDWWQVTPSVFVQAIANGMPAPAPQNPNQFWRCPTCRSLDMVETPEAVHCQHCGKVWEIRDGIYLFK